MTVGYSRPLYVPPFDHRATFSKTMFGWEGPLVAEQRKLHDTPFIRAGAMWSEILDVLREHYSRWKTNQEATP